MLVDIARIATGYEDALKYQFLRASSIHIYLRPKKKKLTLVPVIYMIIIGTPYTMLCIGSAYIGVSND